MSNEKYFQWQMTELNKEFKLTEHSFPDLADGDGQVLVRDARL